MRLNPDRHIIAAAAKDAGNRSMRRANRTQWNEDDWNAAAACHERLTNPQPNRIPRGMK